MRTTTMCLAALLLLAPAPLLAQDSTGSGSAAQGRVDAALEAAVKAGIPVSLLERKVAEGKAKGVPLDRIAAAVEQRLDALADAHEALMKAGLGSTTEGELSVAADAVQGGVSQSAIVAISQRAPDESRAVAIAVLTDLVTLGQASDRALARVEGALARGPEALANLSAEAAGTLHGEAGLGASTSGGAGVQAGVGVGARMEVGAPLGQ